MAVAVEKDTLLDVRNLSVDYAAANGTVHAATNVSFTLKRGEILGLAGESGSGKSTLAYAISRLLRPPAEIVGGEVIYYPRSHDDSDAVHITPSSSRLKGGKRATIHDGAETEPIDILQLTSTQLRAFRWSELSIVFQSAMNALNPVMNVGKQIMDVLKVHRPLMGPDSRKQRALELLKLVGIAPDRMNSYPHELSGGMRQRAVIAIALALSPEIIIMDEPTTALDVVVQREILSEIIRLREQLGFSVIFITHDLSLLLELADKVAIMYAGKLVETASRRDLYLHPRHPYSYGLLKSFPTIHGPRRTMTGIPGSPPDLRNVPAGCAFNPRCPFAFDACRSVVPVLQSSASESPHQLVACHLYNNRLASAGPPSASDFAQKYQAPLLVKEEKGE
ncbi:MAG: ABC transporter ATP-binding protein [Ktedonobacteraceae bacterium]